MYTSLLMLTAALAGVAQVGGVPGDPPANQVSVENCFVTLIEEVQIPSEVQGVLATIPVREGAVIEPGQELARIDDTELQLQKKAAEIEFLVADEQGKNDIIVRAAKASADVAKAEHEEAIETNAKVPGTVPQAEVRRLDLTWRRSVLQIEQAELDFKVARLTAESKHTAVEATEERIRRSALRAPTNGVVAEIYRHVGEWVQPGDPVMHIVRMDRLRAKGDLPASLYAPNEVLGRKATVMVNLSRGRRVPVVGKVDYVSPTVDANGNYQIYVDFDNPVIDGNWVVRPGFGASIAIDLN